MSCPVFLQRGFCRGHWLKAALINHAQSSHRNAVVVSRQFEPKTYKEGERNWPFRPHLKRREYVYRLERVTTASPAGSMDVILTVDIEGIGFKGETVNVSKRTARNFLFPSGAAEYATEENLAKWQELLKTMRRLADMNLPIPMHPKNPWTLNKTHVCVAFRKQGIELRESSIILPEDPITQHGDIEIDVLVNQTDTVTVNATIFPLNLENPDEIPLDLPPVWGSRKMQLGEVILEAIERDQLQKQSSSV